MADTLGLDEDDPNMQTLEDLPEIDGLALEPDPALPELETFAPSPAPAAHFAAPPPASLPVAAVPAPHLSELTADPAAADNDMFSAKDLLGGEDFDLPPPPSGASSQTVSKHLGSFTPPPPAAPKAVSPLGPMGSPVSAAASPVTTPNLLGGVPPPSFGAFKNPAPAFKPPTPFGSTAPAASSLAAPQSGLTKSDASFSLAEVGHAANWAEVRQALTAPQAPPKVAGDLGMLAVHLCRALVRKGIISVDELLAEVEPK